MGLFDKFKKKKGQSDKDSSKSNQQQPTPETLSEGSLPAMPELPDLPENMDAPPSPAEQQNMPVENASEKETPKTDSSQELPDIPRPNDNSTDTTNEEKDLPDLPMSAEQQSTNQHVEEASQSPEQSSSDEDSFLSDDLSGDLGDIDLPDFSDDTVQPNPHLETTTSKTKPKVFENTLSRDDDFATEDTPTKEHHTAPDTLVHIDDVEEGPRYMRVEQYIKITDVINFAKQETETIIEDGNKLLNLDGNKTKEIETFKSDINQTIKSLFKIENTLFKGD